MGSDMSHRLTLWTADTPASCVADCAGLPGFTLCASRRTASAAALNRIGT